MDSGWNWRGIVACVAGFAAMIPFFSTDLYTGPIAHALRGTDIAMLVGLRAATADIGLDPGDAASARD